MRNGTVKGLFTQHKWKVAVGLAIAVVIAVAIPFGIGAAQHQNADDAYQAQRILVTGQAKKDLAAQASFTSVSKDLDALTPKVEKIYADSDGYLPAEMRTKMAEQLKWLHQYQPFIAGKPATRPVVVANTDSSTPELEQDTARLKAQAAENAIRMTQTTRATAAKAAGVKNTNILLAVVVDGVEANTDKKTGAKTVAVNGLAQDAAALATVYPKADDASKQAATTSATTATDLVKKNKPVADQLLDYLAKAAAVKNAHDVQDQKDKDAEAAKTAANSGQPTYTDPTTGETKSTPGYTGGNNRGTGGTGGGNGGGGTSSGGSGGGGGGASSGGAGGGGSTGSGTVSGYPVWDGPALPPNATGGGTNCGSGGISIPSNAVVTSQGYDAGAGCYRINYTPPPVTW